MVPLWYRRVIQMGDTGPDVRIVRRKLGLIPDGPFDRAAIERIRGMTNDKTDVVDEVIATLLGESEANKAGLTPEWFTRPLERHDIGEDVRALRAILGVWDDNRFEHDLEDAVRRFQSARGLLPDGKVNEELARLLGDA